MEVNMTVVIKTSADGRRQYRYEQHSVRVGLKVVTNSKYLGPVSPRRRKAVAPIISLYTVEPPIGIDWMEAERQELAKMVAQEATDKAQAQAFRTKMAGIGLVADLKEYSSPKEKVSATAAPAATAEADAPSSDVSEKGQPIE
jgi:hypothetical protein